MNYKITPLTAYGTCRYENEKVYFKADKRYEQADWQIEITFLDWEDDCYVFSPACAYDGNKIEQVDRAYPPMYKTSEMYENERPLIMKGIPALNVDGSGKIEVTAGDMATPCVGIFYKQKKQAFFVFTEQEVGGKNLGFRIEKGKITVQYPTKREYAYRYVFAPEKDADKGLFVDLGDEFSSKLLIRTFDCETISQFFEYFFRNRKVLLSSPRPENGYTQELWEIMEKHFNQNNYSGKYFGNTRWRQWQCGWCGNAQSSYPLYVKGNEETKARAVQTIDYLVSFAAPSGFFYGYIFDDKIKDDSFHFDDTENDEFAGMRGSHLIRKSGDVLAFLYKHFDVMPVKKEWEIAARNCADAFVRLFDKYGTFGQFVHQETGEMLIGLSCAGASAIGGLARSYRYFKDEKYLNTAKEACEYYYQNFVAKGVTTGGPGEILTAPDSESSYAMVESCVILYETTKEEKWLQYAKDSANLFSSWVMTYAYKFPKGCEFEIQKINTTGSVFANVQNKHSAPGICTFSGDTLYRLYCYTGEKLYLELIKDIAYFIPQCVSTPWKPIYDWDHKHGDDEGRLPEGYICERVNTSDWEMQGCIGGVFKLSCWCETSLVLSFVELMHLPEMQ
ncbi:MAG: hypothetical protein E7352_00165 [Clostridiales bacterium]|nr:hypothetical protein [Clostridiales bacterium]MBE5746580.1 hypothetical protein [Clostridiales bacterium]